MNVLKVTLIAIGAPFMVVLFGALPLILFIKGRDAWQNIPREIYGSRQQRLVGVRPASFWIASALLTEISRLFEWLKWQSASQIAGKASLAILAVVLVYHLVWAARIIHSRASIDARLVRFARYALGGSAMCLLVVAAGLVEILTAK